MQTDPNYIFRQNGIYVIIEKQLDIFTLNHIQVIGITHSYEAALKYSGPNRTIEGPVPVLDQLNFFPEPIKAPFQKPEEIPFPIFRKEFEPIYKPPNFLEKNPFEPANPNNIFNMPDHDDVNLYQPNKSQYDFSMLTNPSSPNRKTPF